ncbi:MAG: NAD(P)H-dependent flavin oxidoreductase [Methyloceanibacter sp.]
MNISKDWPYRRLLDPFSIDVPIVAAPMANFAGLDMAVAVVEAGGLGSLPCAVLSPDQIREGVVEFRSRVNKPLHCIFFCHEVAPPNPRKDRAWIARLAPYFAEFGVEAPTLPLPAGRPPFGEADCAALEDVRPEIVSFHFGLPPAPLLVRVKATGCKLMSTATSVREARFLAEHGVDAIIAQGAEAGGHRGMFIETDPAAQIGTFALVRAIGESVPVIAAGGIADGCAIAGIGARRLGRADRHRLSHLPESTISPLHRATLADPERETAITNVLTGRPARGVVNRFMREQGPINEDAPTFPLARPAIAPLRRCGPKPSRKARSISRRSGRVRRRSCRRRWARAS